jgi:DNA-binding MarR family transcriptional regulator
VTAIDRLSTRLAIDLASDGRLLFIEHAAPRALAVLREAGTPYVTRAGEWHLLDPPGVFVVRPADREAQSSMDPSPDRPLGKGTARIARWLLLHPDDTPTIRGLAHEAKVSEATSSRAIRRLAERDLITVTTAGDRRRRSVAVRDRGALLDTLADESSWRHARRSTWEVGAHSVDEALRLIAQAAKDCGSYAIGELAGAALVRRLVEPATTVLWIPGDDVAAWQDALLAQPARPAPGRITVRVAPDPVVLDWGPGIDGLHVADPVQLYIDCRYAGERAIDAAEALRDQVLQR